MNVEYMKISPDTIMVTNEHGQLSEVDIEYSDLDKGLILENNLEYLNNIIHELEHYVTIDHPFDKNNYLSNLEIPLFATFASATVGALYSQNDGFIIAAGLGGALGVLSVLYTGICNANHLHSVRQKKEAYKAVLIKAYEIRAGVVAELKKLRGNVDFNDKEINQPISLLTDKHFIFNTESELNEEYLNNVASRRLKKDLPIKR